VKIPLLTYWTLAFLAATGVARFGKSRYGARGWRNFLPHNELLTMDEQGNRRSAPSQVENGILGSKENRVYVLDRCRSCNDSGEKS
jgi:hypothetical protein